MHIFNKVQKTKQNQKPNFMEFRYGVEMWRRPFRPSCLQQGTQRHTASGQDAETKSRTTAR